jgi:DNA-directed RNA polymerase specialized sigma subunit
MKTVDGLISEWTEEEKEELKDLIEECRERERRLIENATACKENLTKITECLDLFYSDLYTIKKKAEKLEDELSGIYLIWCNKKTLPS